MTWTTRGSLARASFSTFSSKATLAVLSRLAMGSAPGYSVREPAILRSAALTRADLPAAAMLRTVRAASSRDASEMSSE